MIAARDKGRSVVSGVLGRTMLLGILSALAALAIAAAPASALPLPPLTINGASSSANGPQVNAMLDSQGGDGGGGALYILTVSFPSSNATGDEITAVSGTFNTAEANGHGISSVDEEVGNADPGALFSFFANGSQCFPPGAPDHQSFTCQNYFGGFGPGAQQSYVIDTNQNQNDPTPLSSVNVTVNMCGQTSSDAVLADNCAPPGPTKITKTKINQHTRTASFHYKANHAMHYECELVYKKSIKYRAACGATKKYANALARGQYVFVVWGVNAGGGSARPAAKKFKIG
jgi:hypothetical protein